VSFPTEGGKSSDNAPLSAARKHSICSGFQGLSLSDAIPESERANEAAARAAIDDVPDASLIGNAHRPGGSVAACGERRRFFWSWPDADERLRSVAGKSVGGPVWLACSFGSWLLTER
jgi:hypothetical protein